MSIFQKSVINNHLSQLDQDQVDKAFKKFNENYSFSKIAEIQKMKEEEYQDGFLRDIFVDVFGYILKPDDNYNLAREYKNQTDGKKADGAILKNDKAIAVIELKSTKTKDLTNVTQQAFNYKNNQPECKYVITSNFQKLRFYIDYSNEYEEFDLFNLQKNDFQLLYLLLQKDNILTDLPLKLKTETKFHEENISDKLYKDYSSFKYKIYNNLVKNNPQYDKLTLFKKSQKFLDRLLFVFFAEDTGLVPPNAISKIVEQWQLFIDNDEYFSLYSRFVKFFIHLDKGHKYTTYDLPAYNGGLFAPDEILDDVKIDDEILKDDALLLSSYDFSTDVDVNILGHIFEHSLNEIEEITSEIEGKATDKNKTKRKKDGVFYTPKYITQYIVENTIGKLCIEKREKLGILEIEFDESIKTKKGKISATGKKLFETLQAYKDWLFSLKIVDPACGSGAFLNQALNFLINEHQQIDDIIVELTGEKLRLFDTDKTILEKNLYGVDINEESVEIAKLSLWLRTAQKGRKLSNLNNNIKCGNSLIDDPEVAGEKAFNWQKEFPGIFQKKKKKAWHVTWVAHDTRTSARMIKYKVRERRANGEMHIDRAIYLNENDALKVTEIISNIVVEEKYNCLAYSISEDHIHMLLVCDEDELTNIVRKLKGKSAQKFKEQLGLAKDETFNLWAQKFDRKLITSEKQLANTIKYITNNREKHRAAKNQQGVATPRSESEQEFLKQSQPLVQKMTCTRQHAFRDEYTGGFDVVIGNPPYVFAREKILQVEKEFYTKNYYSANYQVNTYLLFIEQTIKIIKPNAIYGLIVPNAWLMVYSGQGLRKYLLDQCRLYQIINLEGYSFEGVNVETIIILSEKQKIENNDFQVFLSSGKEFVYSHSKNQKDFKTNEGFEFKVFSDVESTSITNKLLSGSVDLDSIVQIKAGLQAYEKGKGNPKQSAEDVKNRPYDYNYKFDEVTYKYLDGKDVGRYFIEWSGLYLKYGKHLAAPRSFNLFSNKKIIVREITGKFPHCIISTYSEDLYLYNRSNIAIIEREGKSINLKYVVAILNSTLMSYYFMKNTAKSVRKLFPKVILKDLRLFPFKEIDETSQIPFILSVDKTQKLFTELINIRQNFIDLLKSKLEIVKFSNKLKNWFYLEFKDFLKELQKAIKILNKEHANNGLQPIVKLSLSEEVEWMQYFNEQKEKAQALQTQINKIDKEIDQMVYQLYNLTDEEIVLVENSIK